MLSSVENLKRENTDLIRIVNDISHLISLTEVDSMIDFLCSRFLEYFIPDRLVFLFQPPRKKQMRQYVYRRLEKTNEDFNSGCFAYFKEYFDKISNHEESGAVYYYDDIKDNLPSEAIDEDLVELNPYIVIPLIAIGGTYGIVFITNKITESEYTDSQISYISRIFSILPLDSFSRLSFTRISLSLSSALVASSRMRMDGFFKNTRAMEIRCFCPPESFTPRSPI